MRMGFTDTYQSRLAQETLSFKFALFLTNILAFLTVLRTNELGIFIFYSILIENSDFGMF